MRNMICDCDNIPSQKSEPEYQNNRTSKASTIIGGSVVPGWKCGAISYELAVLHM
jgi:hypothetical protein